MHPTKVALIDTVMRLLEHMPLDKITADLVLDESGISRGSLYHHFEDLADLHEHALARRFGAIVDASIEQLRAVADTATTSDEVRQLMAALNERIQSPDRARVRGDRLLVVAEAVRGERFRVTFGKEQQRLTDAQADLFRTMQARGLFRNDFDPAAAAVLSQAFTLGRVVDDVSEHPVDPAAWTALINDLISRLFLAD
jgi:AcrR family transcriptional regulator